MSTEIRRGTAGAILSKPVSRIRFLAAKFTGVSMVMLVFSGMATLAILMADRAAAIEFTVGWRYLIPLYVAILSAYLLASLINFISSRPFAEFVRLVSITGPWQRMQRAAEIVVLENSVGRNGGSCDRHLSCPGGHWHFEINDASSSSVPRSLSLSAQRDVLCHEHSYPKTGQKSNNSQ